MKDGGCGWQVGSCNCNLALRLSLRPGSQVISAKRRGSCCIKFLVACTKVCYTFAPAYINYTPGQSQIAKCNNTSSNNNTSRNKKIDCLPAGVKVATATSADKPQVNFKLNKVFSRFFSVLLSLSLHLSPFLCPYLSALISHLGLVGQAWLSC